ncbi:SIR2 family protein [Mycolicibacterium wolinskyi]|uniref:SIR2 family protein n=1 Tax=Mycolicibacterium wolinskyi TaxID=59750 RepID=UPI003BAD564D
MRTASAQITGRQPTWPTIEDVANSVDALIERDSSDIGPFVASWNPLLRHVDEADDISIGSTQRVAKLLQRKFIDASIGDIDTIHEDWSKWAADLVAAMRPSASNSLLIKLRDQLPRIVAELLEVPATTKLSYLADLFALVDGRKQLAVATLNYDLGLETICAESGVTVSDGLESWIDGETDIFETADIALHKLHGSLNWQRDSEDHYRRRIVTVNPTEPGIIFGGRNKLTTRGPYLDLLWRWRSELAKCSRLIIVGYAFADTHVNGLLIQWARTEQPKRLIIVSRSTNWHKTSTGQWLITHAGRAPAFQLRHVPASAKTGIAMSVQEALIPL